MPGRLGIRVLLMEFRNPEQNRRHRSSIMPYFLGLARDRGCIAEWWSIAVPRSHIPLGSSYQVELPEDLFERIKVRLQAYQPDVLVLSERLSDAFLAALRQIAPGSRILDLTTVDSAGPGLPGGAEAQRTILSVTDDLTVDWVLSLLSGSTSSANQSGANESIFDTAPLCFDREMIGDDPDADRRDRLFWRLLTHSLCSYRRSLRKNPFYQDLDSAAIAAHRGCAFCLRHQEVSGPVRKPLSQKRQIERVLRQISAHQAAEASEECGFEYLFEECELSDDLEVFAAAVLERNFRPSTFLTLLRADTLLRKRRELEDLLSGFRSAGHRIGFLSVGAENFSQDENLRLNKGISPDQLWACHEMIQDFHQRFPQTFSWPERGIFAAILFTPWTRPSDLKANIAAARRIGPAWLETALGTRLHLWENAPITELARRQGLVSTTRTCMDELTAYCNSGPGEGEVPWRFQDRRTEAVFRYLIRIEPLRFQARIPSDDPLLLSIRALRATLPRDKVQDPVELADAFVDAFVALGPDAGEEEVFEQVRERLGYRVLLVEFVISGQVGPMGSLFPFIQGFLDSRRVRNLWVTFGAGARIEKTGPSCAVQSAELESDDIVRFERQAAEFRPTHILVSDRISEALQGRLASAAPGASVRWSPVAQRPDGSNSDPDCLAVDEESPHCWQFRDAGWLVDWLDGKPEQTPARRDLVATTRPSYGAIVAGGIPSGLRPPIVVMSLTPCECIAAAEWGVCSGDVDPATCPHDQGRDTCCHLSTVSGAESDPVACAELQLQRVSDTDRGRSFGVFEILDGRMLSCIDRFADRVARLSLPPSRFRLEAGDHCSPQILARAIPVFEASGHSLLVRHSDFRGLNTDNRDAASAFTPSRMPQEVLEVLRDLSRDHPDSFEFVDAGGPTIWSPWTNVHQLGLDVSHAIETGMEPLGAWLFTPLTLLHGSLWAGMARRDWLTVQAFDDLSMLYAASCNRTSWSSIVRWRFRDSRTAAAFSLVIRFCASALRTVHSDSLFAGDLLYEAIRSMQEAGLPCGRADLFAREVIAAQTSPSPPQGREALLDVSATRYRQALDIAESSRPSLDRSDRSVRFLRILHALVARLGPDWSGLVAGDVSEGDGGDGFDLELGLDGRTYRFFMRGLSSRGFLRTAHFCVSHARTTPLASERHLLMVNRFFEVLDRMLARYSPDLLP